MATYIPKLMDINKQYQMAYFDEMRRREEMERQDMMRRAAAKRMMDMQRQSTMGDRGVGNFGLSEGGASVGYTGSLGNQMTWAQGMKRMADQLGVPVEVALKNMGKGAVGGGVQAGPMLSDEPANVRANAPLPKGADAQLSQQYTQAEDTASRAREHQAQVGKTQKEIAEINVPSRMGSIYGSTLSNTRTVLNNLDRMKNDLVVSMSDPMIMPKQKVALQKQLDYVNTQIGQARQDYESALGATTGATTQPKTEGETKPAKQDLNQMGSKRFKKDSPVDTGKMVTTMVVINGQPQSIEMPESLQGLDQDRMALAHLISQERGSWESFSKNDVINLSRLGGAEVLELLKLYEKL